MFEAGLVKGRGCLKAEVVLRSGVSGSYSYIKLVKSLFNYKTGANKAKYQIKFHKKSDPPKRQLPQQKRGSLGRPKAE